MLPYAVMVLLHGPISDAVGRRPVVLVGISLYALASLACAFAPNFAMLLVFRAVQGMTAGTGLVIGRAIVRDLHEGPQAQRLMAVITMIFGIAPAIAPVIGGWIHVALGWRSVFGFMVLIGLALVLASWVRLPETHPPARRLPFDRQPPGLHRLGHRLRSALPAAGALRRPEFRHDAGVRGRGARRGPRSLASDGNPVRVSVRAFHRRLHAGSGTFRKARGPHRSRATGRSGIRGVPGRHRIHDPRCMP